MQLLWLRWECRSVIIQQQIFIQRIQHSSGEDRQCRVPDVRILQLNVIIQQRHLGAAAGHLAGRV